MIEDKRVVPMAVVRRLSRYYRYLNELSDTGIDRISSQAFANKLGFTASQVRQDFAYLSSSGHRGLGYDVEILKDELMKTLGINKEKKCILIGIGSLGTALMSINFHDLGFNLVAVFDNNENVIGTDVRGNFVYDISTLSEICTNKQPQVAIICTPTAAANDLVPSLYDLGIRYFWNFSHFDIAKIYPDAKVENVHLKDSMMTLGFQIND